MKAAERQRVERVVRSLLKIAEEVMPPYMHDDRRLVAARRLLSDLDLEMWKRVAVKARKKLDLKKGRTRRSS
jgi:hypothetical protein